MNYKALEVIVHVTRCYQLVVKGFASDLYIFDFSSSRCVMFSPSRSRHPVAVSMIAGCKLCIEVQKIPFASQIGPFFQSYGGAGTPRTENVFSDAAMHTFRGVICPPDNLL